MRRLLVVAFVLAVTPGAATGTANRPLLTYAVAPIQLREMALVQGLGLCATDLHGHTFRLTAADTVDGASWSPAGGSLAFVGPSWEAGNHESDLYVTDAQGQHTRNLTRLPESGAGGALTAFGWSPDGSELGGTWSVFGNDLFVAKVDGTSFRVLARGDFANNSFVYGDSWSPDGAVILFTTHHYPNDVPSISVIRPDGAGEHMLLDSAGEASWSPDGTRFAYVSYVKDRGTGLGVARSDGSDAHVLLRVANQIRQPVWSPDGNQLAYFESANGTRGKLRAVRADGTDDRVLAPAAGPPAWSPDGSLIAFAHYSGKARRVALINPDGTHERDVAAGFDPAWRTPAALPSHRRPCIVHGTSKADVIHGTARGEAIFAGSGNDRVYGGGGDDVIVGGPGQDRLFGGSGNDFFDTRDRRRDFAFGGRGLDWAFDDPVDVVSVEFRRP